MTDNPMVTRVIAVQKYIGQDIAQYAAKFDIRPYVNGKQNKGWKGLVLERLAGLGNNNLRAPNGLTFDIKSVSFKKREDVFVPKETMAITMFTPADVIKESFLESHCWNKLKSLVFCAVEWTGTNAEGGILLDVTSLDFVEDAELIREVAADYELIRRKLITEGFEALTGKDGKWIQARTKGAGHGSKSRAFYAKKPFVVKIFDESKKG
jgi:DNA mismatch repair protein MutH